MAKLREYIMVSFDTPENANQALVEIEKKYFRSSFSTNVFNRVEGTRVYVQKASSFVKDDYIKEELLGMEGALPDGCHIT